MAHENDWVADVISRQKTNVWRFKEWNNYTPYIASSVWTDGTNVYYSDGSNQYVLDKSTSTWNPKTWSGLSSFDGYGIWTDGNNIYYSNGSDQYVLNKDTSTWTPKTWNGFTNFYGNHVWTDGDNIYYSYGNNEYVLNKDTSTWTPKTWTGITSLSSFRAIYIWKDGDNIYYSYNSAQYVLNKSTSTWTPKTWGGITSFIGQYIWTDGENYYLSRGNGGQYVLNKSTSTWTPKTWVNTPNAFFGHYIWTDGENCYFSNGGVQYELESELITNTPYRLNFPEMIESVDLNDKWVSDVIGSKITDHWNNKEWSDFTPNKGNFIWSDGENTYYSHPNVGNYIFDRITGTWIQKTWTSLSELYGSDIWTDGENVYYSRSSTQLIFNSSTHDWETKTWSGNPPVAGAYVWTDGVNFYWSQGQNHYVLDKTSDRWRSKTWYGLTRFTATHIWTDGENVYYSTLPATNNQWVLDKSSSTWIQKTWEGPNIEGEDIWKYGGNIYYSHGSTIQWIFNKNTSTWTRKTWTGSTDFYGQNVWIDKNNIYYSSGEKQYALANMNITSVPYRYDFPKMIESVDIDNAWITHDVPDPATEGLRFLKLTYHLTVNWEGGGTNNISVSTDIPEAFKRSDHLYVSSSMGYHQVWMVINTEIPQCPYQCRMTFDSNANKLLETLDFIAPVFYIYRARNATRQAAFNPDKINSALYSETSKNTALADTRQYLSTPYNYACEPRVTFNHGSGGAFPTEPGSTVVTIDIIFAFTAEQDDRYADLLARYPDHVSPFEYIKNAVPYRPAFPALVESVDISDKWLISDDIPFRWNFPDLIRSSANPVQPPSYFIFKGRSSAEFGSIEILPLCLKHEEKTDFINFIYGNPYVSETSILRSKVITITLNLSDISPANIDRVNAWLIGTGKLVLSHDPHRYYIATCNNALTGQKLVNTLGKVAVQFNVMPYKYDLKEKESFEPVDLAEETLHKTAAIYYKGSAPAESTFKITATGNIEIYNVQTEKTVEIKGLTEYCIINIKARKVTDESNLNILNRTYGDIFDLMLVPGYNYFFLSGSVTAVEVKKKTRWY